MQVFNSKIKKHLRFSSVNMVFHFKLVQSVWLVLGFDDILISAAFIYF